MATEPDTHAQPLIDLALRYRRLIDRIMGSLDERLDEADLDESLVSERLMSAQDGPAVAALLNELASAINAHRQGFARALEGFRQERDQCIPKGSADDRLKAGLFGALERDLAAQAARLARYGELAEGAHRLAHRLAEQAQPGSEGRVDASQMIAQREILMQLAKAARN